MQQIRDLQLLGSTNPQDYLNIAAANGVNLSTETAQFVADNITSENELDQISALREINATYFQIETDLEAQVPGLSIDGSALNSLTPEQQADLRSRIKEINKAIKVNDVATAQQLMQELKELYPDAVTGNYDEWNPADFRTYTDQTAKNTWTLEAKSQFNQGNIDDAANILIDKVIDPLTVESKFDSLWDTSSTERRKEILESANMDVDSVPITSEEKALYVAHDMLSGMNKTTVEEIYQSYFDNAGGVSIAGVPLKEWMMQPQNADMVRSWIFQVISGPYEIDENGLIVPKSGQQLPPWNPDANNSHYFIDWAMADSYDAEADELNFTYSGGNGYEDDDVFQTSDGYMAYRNQMDEAWEDYKKNPNNELDKQSWFDDVKPVWDGTNVIFNGEAQETFDGEPDDTTDNEIIINPDVNQKLENLTKFENLITSNTDVTNGDVVNSIDSINDPPKTLAEINDWINTGKTGPGGWINFNGVALKPTDGRSGDGSDFGTFELPDGTLVSLVNEGFHEGKWFPGKYGTGSLDWRSNDPGVNKLIIDVERLSEDELALIGQWMDEEVSQFWIIENGDVISFNAEQGKPDTDMLSFEEWLATQG